MNPDQRLVQRHLDGRLGHLDARTLEQVLLADPALSSYHARLAALDRLLGEAHGDRVLRMDQAALTAPANLKLDRLRAHLAAHPPGRRVMRMSVGDLLLGVLVASSVLMMCALAGSFADLLPLGLLAMTATVAGVVLIILARSLRDLEATLSRRWLSRRFITVGEGDVLVYRAIGAALVVGGMWLSWKSF